MKVSIISLLGLLLTTACVYEGKPFKESKILAGTSVSAATLNEGYHTYLEYCVQCHGVSGKGDGPASIGLLPPPRDFTQGLYKFVWTNYGDLPHDEDLHRIIRHGLKGTAMLNWDISDERLAAVTHYIKTFAPEVWEGEDKVVGTKFETPADPFGPEKKAEAIERGKKVYHVDASCIQCHRGYETRADIKKWGGDSTAADLYQLKGQESEFNYKALPPDFTLHALRSVNDTNSLVQRVMYGVHGSSMPGWKDIISDEDIWAVTYYVESLIELKGTPKRKELLNTLNNQK